MLFSGDAAVPTKWLDKSGFIEMGKVYDHPRLKKITGRLLLKELVKDLQKHEVDRAKMVRKDENNENDLKPFLTFDDVPTLGKKFVLHGYTSVVETLNTITHKAQLLSQLRPDAQPWLLLFTDGEENVDGEDLEKEFAEPDHQFPRNKKDYEYWKRLKVYHAGLKNATDKDRKKATETYHEEVRKELTKHLDPMREKQVRAFTFALGNECDEVLLRAITDGTNGPDEKAASQRIGAYYNPTDNVELLKRLQQVCWELRQYWVLPPKWEGLAGEDRFVLPEPAPWRDLGVMLSRKPAQKGGQANAPRTEDAAFDQTIKDMAAPHQSVARLLPLRPDGETHSQPPAEDQRQAIED